MLDVGCWMLDVPLWDLRHTCHVATDGFNHFIRLDEEFQFHLLELAGAEGEIARCDFVAKRLADLRDAERDFHSRGIEHVFELREDGLGSFGAEIGNALIALNWTD